MTEDDALDVEFTLGEVVEISPEAKTFGSIEDAIEYLGASGFDVSLATMQVMKLRGDSAKLAEVLSPEWKADQERASLVMAKTLDRVRALEAENKGLVEKSELLRDTYEDVLKGRDKWKKQASDLKKHLEGWKRGHRRLSEEAASLKEHADKEDVRAKAYAAGSIAEWQDKLASETRRRESAEQALRRYETMVEAMSASETLRAESARVVDQLAYTVSRLAQSIPTIT